MIGHRGFAAFCAEVFHETGHGKVIAFSGRDAAAMKESAARFGVEKTFTDWREMIADPDVELVHIVTPPDKHAEMAIAALEAGKHVLIEKPLAVTDDEAAAILAAQEKSGKVAAINYVMRHDPLYDIVLRIAGSGWLSNLTHVGFENYASDEGLGDDHWFWDKAQSGGIFVEHGVHFFDVIGNIIGSPARQVIGKTWNRTDGTNKEDRVLAVVSYWNEVEATFYHAFNRPGALEKQTAHFAFERGHVVLDGWIPYGLEMKATIAEGALEGLKALLPSLEIVEEFAADHKIRGRGRDLAVRYAVKASERLAGPTPVYRQAVADVIADIASAVRAPEHPLRVGIRDGATSLCVATAARLSAETGAAVEIAGHGV